MFKFFIFIIFFIHSASAKDFTKPPSVKLRNEVSFVSEVTLQKKQTQSPGKTLLKFTLLKDLHNKSDNSINISVQSSLAKTLSVNENYIIAYQKVRKSKVRGLKTYIPNENGPFLMNVEGANPAIFRSNPLLIKQLLSSPSMERTNPQKLINDIFTGLSQKDPKIKDFFIRELINWDALHQHLEKKHFEKLLAIYNDLDAPIGLRIALLEPRQLIHQAIGREKFEPIVFNILKYYPVNMDTSSQIPTLVLQALRFIEKNDSIDSNMISRWTRSNASSIAEHALLMLDKSNPSQALESAKDRLENTQIHDTTRRTLTRFVSSKERK